MSSRPLYPPQSVITNGNMAGNLTSIVTVISNLPMMSYSYSWTGTSPVGLITVQVSNDYSTNSDGTVNNAGTWNTLTLSVPGAVSGNTGVGYIDIDTLAAQAIRTVYTATSGTGTLQAVFKGKVA